MMRTLYVALAMWACSTTQSAANCAATPATIEVTESRNSKLADGLAGEAELVVDIVYKGRICDGDDARLGKILAPYLGRIRSFGAAAQLHLDLDGGDFAEGLAIAKRVWKNNVLTLVDKGADCSSACAFVFMAGNINEYEGENRSARFLDVAGQLGFHAPFVDGSCVQSQSCEARNVTYRQAMEDISALLLGTDGVGWHPRLVGEMLKTPWKGLHVIKTVDDAGRYRIGLKGYKRTNKVTKTRVMTACLNKHRWNDEDLSKRFTPGSYKELVFDRAERDVAVKVKTEPNGEKVTVYSMSIEEMEPIRCEVTVRGGGYWIKLFDTKEEFLEAWQMEPPLTLLVNLQR